MKRLAWITAIALATLIGTYVLWELRAVIVVFVLSLWTAAAIRPLVDWFEQRGLRRSLALAAPYALGALLVASLALLAAMPLASELQRLGDDAITGYEEITWRWQEGTTWQRALVDRLPNPTRLYDDLFGRRGVDTLWSVLGFTFGLFWVLLNALLIVVLSLYWSIDRVHFERLWLSLLSVEHRTTALRVWRDIEHEAGRYLRSQVLICVVAGLLLGISYQALGYPYPALMAIAAAVLWLIPWLGTLLASLATLLLAIPVLATNGGDTSGFTVGAAVLLTFAVLVFFEIWLEPRLFERRRYTSLLVVLIVIGMADVFGLIGFILAPPIAAAIQIVGGHLLRIRLSEPKRQRTIDPAALTERLARVRAQLEELAEPPPGLVSLAGRLEQLLAEVSELPRPAPDGQAILVYSGDSDTASLAS